MDCAPTRIPRVSAGLRPVLGEAERVGHHERHQVLGGHHPERAARAVPLGEAAHRVAPAVGARQERGHPLPAVALEDRRGGVVARDGEHVRAEGEDARQQRVEALERGDLGVEVAVLARLVGVLVVQEEEVVAAPTARASVSISSANVPPVLSTSMPTRRARPRYIGYAAMAAARSPNVSGKRGRCGCWSKPRSRSMLAGAASREQRARGLHEGVHERGGLRPPRARGRRTGRGGTPELLRIRLGEPARTDAAPRRTRTKRCSFTGSTRTSTPSRRIARSRSTRRTQTSVAMRPARRSVIAPRASTVQKLPARGHVARPQLEVDAERLEHAAAHRIAQGIVAEEAEVAGPAARA